MERQEEGLERDARETPNEQHVMGCSIILQPTTMAKTLLGSESSSSYYWFVLEGAYKGVLAVSVTQQGNCCKI
ncbi:hypothetical protein STEG23_015921 [Scotinomys teguina]